MKMEPKTIFSIGILVILALVLLNAGAAVVGWFIAGIAIGFIAGFSLATIAKRAKVDVDKEKP